jgi:uncharacterized protein DUF2804
MTALPARGPAARELGLPLPPARMPLLRAGRPLKRWRYVGVFSPEAIVCAAEAWVGPLGQRFWGVAEPEGRLWSGRALVGTGGVSASAAGLRVHARDRRRGVPVEASVVLDPAAPPHVVESVSASGRAGYVWTRKRGGVAASGRVRVGGRSRELAAARAVVDETAGYHARHTTWRWSAGVGWGSDGRPVAWNLVEGVNDDPEGSERTVWAGVRASEAPPVRFADDLSRVDCVDGATLRFHAWATLAHRTDLGVVRSAYRQPFGSFSGELPGGIDLAEGYGVMEHHDARW